MINEHLEELASLHVLGLLTPPEEKAFAATLARDPELQALVTSLLTARDALAGRWVQTAGPASEVVEGIAQGVDNSGALLVHTAQGVRKINSSEVSVRPVAPPVPTNP